MYSNIIKCKRSVQAAEGVDAHKHIVSRKLDCEQRLIIVRRTARKVDVRCVTTHADAYRNYEEYAIVSFLRNMLI